MTNKEKERIRREMLLHLRALAPTYVQAASARLRELLLPRLEGLRNICLYAPLPHEVDLLPLLREAPEHRYYFPRCMPGKQLSFHRVQEPGKELIPGAMGILTPRAELPVIEPQEVDLVVVPGLAFEQQSDGSATRLGYGGGYYDRYLPQLPTGAHTVALALPEQLLTELPAETHDVRVQTLIALGQEF